MKHKSKKSRSQHQANSKETDSKTILWIIKIIINIQRKMEDNACMNKDVKNNKDNLKIKNVIISLVQSFSRVWLSVTPWTAALQASLSITNFWSLLRLMSIELVMPSNHLILCHPLLLLPSVFPNIRVFSNESVLCMRWPKYWSFSFNISPSNEYSGLISFRMDWLELLAVQGTFKSLLQNHSSKASILQCSAFFIV